MPRTATEDLRITALEPDELLEVAGVLASLPAHLTYRLTGSSPGTTTLVNTVEIHPSGALRLVASAARKRIERSVAENLGMLKARLEGQPPA